uniref:Uncharacterized protein n=1 Tax=Cacopsylla melanoneura TaxID=428564 RepID=A0A8D8TDW9_9HEMI
MQSPHDTDRRDTVVGAVAWLHLLDEERIGGEHNSHHHPLQRTFLRLSWESQMSWGAFVQTLPLTSLPLLVYWMMTSVIDYPYPILTSPHLGPGPTQWPAFTPAPVRAAMAPSR